jgi:hypothetical protein
MVSEFAVDDDVDNRPVVEVSHDPH